ncbi:MAG: SDR family oxidoreductase [Thermoplasmata archaeon]|nr:SDR family oxidoreductase [Thermoplasmata archaeon]
MKLGWLRSAARPEKGAPVAPLALVTGTCQGLGLTLARYLAGEGYDLIVTARGSFDLRLAEDRLNAFGGKVWPFAGDVSDPGFRQTLEEVVAARGSLELLVNNASELGPTPLPRLVEYPLDELERLFQVNVLAPLALVQSLAPYLRKAGGRVVNISADAGLADRAGWGGYGSSQAALEVISFVLAQELESEKISVVAVDPGELSHAWDPIACPIDDDSDNPRPEVTLPFWSWLLQQDPRALSGRRFRAQANPWEAPL